MDISNPGLVLGVAMKIVFSLRYVRRCCELSCKYASLRSLGKKINMLNKIKKGEYSVVKQLILILSTIIITVIVTGCMKYGIGFVSGRNNILGDWMDCRYEMQNFNQNKTYRITIEAFNGNVAKVVLPPNTTAADYFFAIKKGRYRWTDQVELNVTFETLIDGKWVLTHSEKRSAREGIIFKIICNPDAQEMKDRLKKKQFEIFSKVLNPRPGIPM